MLRQWGHSTGQAGAGLQVLQQGDKMGWGQGSAISWGGGLGVGGWHPLTSPTFRTEHLGSVHSLLRGGGARGGRTTGNGGT